MNLDDESHFGLRREAKSGHIRMDLDARSDNSSTVALAKVEAAGQKGLSGKVQSFLTGCQL